MSIYLSSFKNTFNSIYNAGVSLGTSTMGYAQKAAEYTATQASNAMSYLAAQVSKVAEKTFETAQEMTAEMITNKISDAITTSFSKKNLNTILKKNETRTKIKKTFVEKFFKKIYDPFNLKTKIIASLENKETVNITRKSHDKIKAAFKDYTSEESVVAVADVVLDTIGETIEKFNKAEIELSNSTETIQTKLLEQFGYANETFSTFKFKAKQSIEKNVTALLKKKLITKDDHVITIKFKEFAIEITRTLLGTWILKALDCVLETFEEILANPESYFEKIDELNRKGYMDIQVLPGFNFHITKEQFDMFKGNLDASMHTIYWIFLLKLTENLLNIENRDINLDKRWEMTADRIQAFTSKMIGIGNNSPTSSIAGIGLKFSTFALRLTNPNEAPKWLKGIKLSKIIHSLYEGIKTAINKDLPSYA